MSALITWAIAQETGVQPDRRVEAKKYSANLKAELKCTTPGCPAQLYFVPPHSVLGKKIIPAYFARKPGQIHDRSRGCDYSNTDDEKKNRHAEHESRLNRFFTATGQKYIYLNSGSEDKDFLLPFEEKHPLQYMGRHLTAKRRPNDASYSVSSAKDLERFSRVLPFEDSFYDGVLVIGNGFRLSFRRFMTYDFKSLFNEGFALAEVGYRHPVVTEVVPLPAKTSMNMEASKPVSFVPCRPVEVEGAKSGFKYHVQPVLMLEVPELAAQFKDSAHYLVWAHSVKVDPEMVKQQTRAIKMGERDNAVEFHLRVTKASQFVQLRDADTHSPGRNGAGQPKRVVTVSPAIDLKAAASPKKESSIPTASRWNTKTIRGRERHHSSDRNQLTL